jgi:hypothetical protein
MAGACRAAQQRPCNSVHPSASIAFDDDNRPVPAVGFDFDAVDGEPASAEDICRFQQEIIVRLLDFLETKGKPAHVGRRAILLGHLIRPSATQQSLAARLGVTPGRVCQELKILKLEIDNVYRPGMNGTPEKIKHHGHR